MPKKKKRSNAAVKKMTSWVLPSQATEKLQVTSITRTVG